MATENRQQPGEAFPSRATRCQLALVLLLLVGGSALAWFLVAWLW